jgi:GxxExxY protein
LAGLNGQFTAEGAEGAEVVDINTTSGIIVDCSLKVHKAFGPGLLESVYHTCLLHELCKCGQTVESNLELPVIYDGLRMDVGYRIDLLVNDHVIVEIKAVERIHPIHQAQLLSYMKLSGRKVGLLINFNVPRLKDGITRLAHGL